MNVQAAVGEVMLGASLQQIAGELREQRLRDLGLRPDDVVPDTVQAEVAAFMRQLARHLGDRHAGEPRVGQALRDWVWLCDHYEAWDALLTGFVVEGRESLLRRGRMMFPGPLTAHWGDA